MNFFVSSKKEISFPAVFLSAFLVSIFSLIHLPQGFAASPSLRGAEQEETKNLDPLRASVSTLTWAPRQVLNGTLVGVEKTADKLSDKDFIEKVKDILYIYERKLLWFPLVTYASGFRAGYGGGFYYKDAGWRSLLRTSLHDAHYWSLNFKTSHTRDTSIGKWENAFLAVTEKKDDRRYYGLGADPHNDGRNAFVGTHDYGVYTESRRKLQWSSSLAPKSSPLKFEYLGYLQRRSFEDHGDGNNDVREIFDHSQIPGFSKPVKHLYNEASVEIDTRQEKKMLTPGFRSELYSGIAAGLGKEQTHLFRTGFDAAGFIPTFAKNRLLVPRLTADLVDNINDKPIPFSEYPRQHNFRGVSSREILRSDRVSLVPSLEYQWPLSGVLAGHLFMDTLFVGPNPTSVRWHEGLWAAGAGIDLHLFDRELGRIELAMGSEGFQTTITVGMPLKTNHRKDW